MAKTLLNWDDLPGASGYRLYFRREDTGVEEFVDLPTSHHPVYLLSQFPAPPGFVYLLKVAAVDEWGSEGILTVELHYQVPLPAPPNFRLE